MDPRVLVPRLFSFLLAIGVLLAPTPAAGEEDSATDNELTTATVGVASVLGTVRVTGADGTEIIPDQLQNLPTDTQILVARDGSAVVQWSDGSEAILSKDAVARVV